MADDKPAELGKHDKGGLNLAVTNNWVKIYTHKSSKTDGDATWWRCQLCDKPGKEVPPKKDVYTEVQSHFIHSHDPPERHEYDDIDDKCTESYFCWPVATIKHRAKKEEKKLEKLAAGAAEMKAAQETNVSKQAEEEDPMGKAIDALVAAGFKADCSSLAWLSKEVKERTGEPPPKKPRGMMRELASLKS